MLNEGCWDRTGSLTPFLTIGETPKFTPGAAIPQYRCLAWWEPYPYRTQVLTLSTSLAMTSLGNILPLTFPMIYSSN